VWWTAKYKTRWLSDGSVVSGNPIFTNIIWNEIGRGADLESVESWLAENPHVVDELTAMVFASRSPRYTDFFPAESIDVAQAKEGEKLFVENCARCHGVYEKAWSRSDAALLTPEESLRTDRILYHARTPVVDVGTDAHRAQGMAGLAEGLNRLSISQRNGVVVEVESGYVPPPLEGIWARWPYFHNNSVPSLCAVLTRSAERPRTFYAGEAENKDTDFDVDCVGYPLEAKAPASWKRNTARRMDTRRRGLGNQGHDEGIFLDGGKERYTPAQKRALIAFLKTL
jgi:mono/diheme cytochrome c family protein